MLNVINLSLKEESKLESKLEKLTVSKLKQKAKKNLSCKIFFNNKIITY